MYRKHFSDKGLIDCRVGYSGGLTENPDYKTVCTDTTDHAEAIQISYDPLKTTYAELLEFFYRIHDPTSLNKQGRNEGRQYRSVVFYHSPDQQKAIQQVEKEVQEKYYPHHKIVTEVAPFTVFWDAEDYHQIYLDKNPDGYHCPNHVLRTEPKSKDE